MLLFGVLFDMDIVLYALKIHAVELVQSVQFVRERDMMFNFDRCATGQKPLLEN